MDGHLLSTNLLSWPEAPRLLRLRFVRAPPASIVPNKPFEVILSVTDDLGDAAFGWNQLSIRFSAKALETDASPLTVEVLDKNEHFARLEEANGSIHAIKLVLRCGESLRPSGSFSLAVASYAKIPAIPDLDGWKLDFLRYVGISNPDCAELAEDPFVVLGARTQAIRWAPQRAHDPTKVRSFIRTFQPDVGTLEIIERPYAAGGLGIGGGHVWDCAIVLSFLLWKMPTQPDALVIELGAGCGLVSVAASRQVWLRSILATDLAETVEGTLAETSSANTTAQIPVVCATLGWGEALDAQVVDYVQLSDAQRLLVLAADVLYNPSSHEAFLTTFVSLQKVARTAGKEAADLLIAYRPRTDGDYAFFASARSRGLEVTQTALIGTVSVWSVR